MLKIVKNEIKGKTNEKCDERLHKKTAYWSMMVPAFQVKICEQTVLFLLFPLFTTIHFVNVFSLNKPQIRSNLSN